MNVKRIFLFFIILLIGVSVVSANDTIESNNLDDSNIISTNVQDNALNDNNFDDNKLSKELATKSSIKKDSKTVILNSTTFDDYVSGGKFNDKINDGDTIDIQGMLDGTHFGLTVDKPLNIISSTHNAYIGADSPIGFTIVTSGSGTNITGIHFNNTHFVVKTAHNINLNNITVETSGNLVGSGQGVTSIREDSTNVTINNSYFRSENNLGVSTLVCAVAQNVLIENCTIEAIGFCGNLVYFTTYNVDFDSSRGYGNRNITFRNNHIIGLNAIQQSICYGLTMEGKGHTIENNLIEYGYYCLQQQANLAEADEVDQIIIRNNTIPYGTNNIAFAQVENNTFNDIEHLGNSNFTNNIVNNMNITGSGNYYNNSINILTVKTSNANITENNITNYVDIEGNNNTLQNNSFNMLINSGENNTLDNIDVLTLDDVIIINNENLFDYGSRSNNLARINRIPDNTFVIVDGDSIYTASQLLINTTANNTVIQINSNKIYNLTVNATNITIKDTFMPKADITATESTKLVNSVFLASDTMDKLVLENSTINNDYIIFDSDKYDQIFDTNTNILLDNITDGSTIVLRNKTASGATNNYNTPIIINKKVNIICLDNIIYNGDITFTSGASSSNMTNMNINATVNIESDNITITHSTLKNIILKNSNNNIIDNNTISTDTTAIILENSSYNNIISNRINTNSQYTIQMDTNSSNNNITNNYLKSDIEYNNFTINADFENNNIYNNLPEIFGTRIAMEVPSTAILNTPTQINITVNYYNGSVTNGKVLILVNGIQKDEISLTDGMLTTNITFTDDGINTIKVRYYSTELFANSALSRNITAKKITTNLEFTETPTAKIGENMTVTLNVTDEYQENINEGNITLTIKDDTYSVEIHNGIATTNITVIETYMGSQITAYYAGTDTRYEKTVTSTLNIQKGEAIITLLPTQITDNGITLTAYFTDINGNPITGTARARFEGTGIRSPFITPADSKASYEITPKPTGDFGINVTFRNSNAFDTKTQEFIIPINGSKNITITLNAENTKIGETLTLTADVKDEDNNPVDGEILLFNIADNTYRTTITNGTATYTTTTDENYYNKQITATMDANYKYNEATSNTIQLEKGDVLLTVVQEETDDKIVITAKVTDINNNSINRGSILFGEEEIPLTDSQATYEMSSNIQEDVTLDVTFTYNEAFNDKTEQITIEAKEIPLELKIDTTEFVKASTTNITASIYRGESIASDINTGKVVFKVNGKTLKDSNGKVIYAKVVNGTATIYDYTIPDTWTNTTTIQAVYSGSSQYSSIKTEKETITITKLQPTITFSDITAKANDNIQIQVHVTQAGNPINTGKIIIKINGKTLKDSTGKIIYAQIINGTATLNYTVPSNMKAKDYTLNAVFISNEYDRVESNQTLTITN